MRDVFYTLLVVWIIWRIMNGVNSMRSNASSKNTNTGPQSAPRPDTTSAAKRSRIPDSEGEYVDFEEVK